MECLDCKKLSLKKVNIKGDVLGKFGLFEIEQTFINNRNKVLEVCYTFPINDTATIIGFEVVVGDRVIKGKCKEKNKAEKEYCDNIIKGNSAYLLEEQSKNTFRISIGRLDKKEEVKIKIKYIDKFEIVDNNINVFIPTLVAPKYKSTITEKLMYGKVDYTVDFNINISKSLKCSSIQSETHKFKIYNEQQNQRVEVLNYDMSKDFKLSIELKNELLSNALISKNRDGKQTIFLSFMPEITDTYEDSEREYLFLVDVSGSMRGSNLEESKRAIIKCLKQLDNGDKFNIIPFASSYSYMSLESVEYNETTLAEAIKYVNSLEADGGTEILEPIKFALYEEDTNKTILLFTDGEVGNEDEIIDYVKDNIGKNRLFAFGIDDNVNKYFISELSKVGQGKSELIQPNEKIDEKIFRTFERIQTPLVENIKVNYGKNKLENELRDDLVLFNYEFFNVFAQIESLADDIALTGNILDKEYSWIIKQEDVIKTNLDLEVIYAKIQIDWLEDFDRKVNIDRLTTTIRKKIVKIAEKYNINSKYTSFISVYERENRIIDIPVREEIVLSNNFIKDKMRGCIDFLTSGYYSYDVDDMNDCCMDSLVFDSYEQREPLTHTKGFNTLGYEYIEPRFNIEKQEEEKESLWEKLQNTLSSYWELFITQDNKDILIYLLFVFYFIENLEFDYEADYENLFDYLKNHKKEFENDDKIQTLIALLCFEFDEDDELRQQLLNLLNKTYRKMVYCNINIKIDLKKLNETQLEQILQESPTNETIVKLLEHYLFDYFNPNNEEIP